SRAYELRAIARAFEAIGWEDRPPVAALVSAVRKTKPDSSSFSAAHRLGLLEKPDASVIDALREGLKSRERRMVCLSTLSLGRLAPGSADAAPDLARLLASIELSEAMNVWDATKAFYAMEALGRLGSAASAALPTLTKMIRAIEKQYWGVLTV